MMYTDVFVFDQARYFYDTAPTLPLFKNKLPFSKQLILRVCMDAIRRHAYCACPDIFYGSFLTSIGEGGFGVFAWPERQCVV